jgi:hypothetical protein
VRGAISDGRPYRDRNAPTAGVYRDSVRIRTKLIAAFSIIIGAAAAVLTCYALFIEAQAASLLKDVTAITVGSSTASDVEQLTRKHSRYLVSRESSDELVITTFKVENRWLSALRLEPDAWFGASVSLKNGRAYHIEAWLMRSMNIFPTFGASAGMVDEYAEYPLYLSGREHFSFPTPVGKPYLKVLLDSHASAVQRQHAFNFSFRCLIKPGGGCDLPCDYLPSAWQDWKVYLREFGASDFFNQHYPNSSRCKQ